MVSALVVLLVSGLWLIWNYRPIAVDWSVVADGPGWVRNVALLRFTHRGAGSVVTMAALALAVEGTVLARSTHRWRVVVPGALVTALTVVAGISGSILAWDAIALVSADIGRDDGTGFRLLYSPLVREWRVDGRAFPPDAMPRWFWAHVVVVPVLLLVVLVATTVRFRRTRSGVPSPGPTPG
jgi:quinol-cytochrome oxidoreductase complex cytochrome b subunit